MSTLSTHSTGGTAVITTLTHPIDCQGCDREHWLLPSGLEVTVRPSSGGRVLIVLDGRVYRADARALAGATR